jgi:uncharacterized protein DUF2442
MQAIATCKSRCTSWNNIEIGYDKLGETFMAKTEVVRIGDRTWTQAAWDRMLANADQASAEYARRWPQVVAVRYESKTGLVILNLSNGVQLGVPADKLQGVADATHAERSDVVILGPNRAIEFPTLDQQFTVAGLLSGVFGTRAWMSALARRKGRSKSASKTDTARTTAHKRSQPRAPATTHS